MAIPDFITSISRLDGSLGIQDILKKRVEKAFLHNLNTGQTERFLINPPEFQESYEASYKRHSSIGLSHERLQFVGNINTKIPVSVFFDQLLYTQLNSRGGFSRVGSNTPHTNTPNEAEKWRRFLISLIYPRRGNQIAQVSPPEVLFHWPGMISMKVRITRVSFRHILFETGTPRARAFIADIQMEEDTPERIWSDDILRNGTLGKRV